MDSNCEEHNLCCTAYYNNRWKDYLFNLCIQKRKDEENTRELTDVKSAKLSELNWIKICNVVQLEGGQKP